MGKPGLWELVIIAILVIVIFGGKRLPELGRGLGQALANFRGAVREPDKSAGPSSAAPPSTEAAPTAPAEAGQNTSAGTDGDRA